MRRPTGSVLALLLLVVAVMLIFLLAVVAIGARHGQLVRANLNSVAAVQAAEAGVHAAINRLAGDSAWSAGFTDEPLGGELQQRYSVSVVNNSLGSAPVTGPNGVSVPAGMVFLLATGTCHDGAITRQVEVFLGTPIPFGYAVATGGYFNTSASGTVWGSIKSATDLVIEATLKVEPVQGQGRVLCCEDMSVKGGLTVDASQDVRARGEIEGTDKIHGTTSIYPHDTSLDTEPFIMDGRTTPEGAPEGYEVMPNPDMDELLAQAVVHNGYTVYGGANKTLDLDGQVHYFPDGVQFNSGAKLVGSGTIVVGNAHSAVFDIPLDHDLSVIAVDGHSGTVGGAEIHFNKSTRLRGLVFCHGNVYSKADFRLEGRMITYGDGQFLHTGAHLDVALEPAHVTCPGFTAFFGSGTVPGGLGIVSWQRL